MLYPCLVDFFANDFASTHQRGFRSLERRWMEIQWRSNGAVIVNLTTSIGNECCHPTCTGYRICIVYEISGWWFQSMEFWMNEWLSIIWIGNKNESSFPSDEVSRLGWLFRSICVIQNGPEGGGLASRMTLLGLRCVARLLGEFGMLISILWSIWTWYDLVNRVFCCHIPQVWICR